MRIHDVSRRAACFASLAASALLLSAFAAPHPTHIVKVTARDFAFDAPASVPAGLTTLRMINRGKELHHISLVRFERGHTLPELYAAMKSGGPFPAWVHTMGGPNATVPGGEASTTADLAPGSYALLCLVPSPDGVPHVMKGMGKALAVVGAHAARVSPAAAAPPALTLRLEDYKFHLSSPLIAGTHTIRVIDDAAQAHEVFIVRLAPGKSARDMAAWIDKQVGPPPGMPMGGVSALDHGVWNDVTLTFTPGEYALLCFLPDAKDGKPHAAHGMVDQVTIR